MWSLLHWDKHRVGLHILSALSGQITWAPTLYVPLPHYNHYAEGMTEEMEGFRGRGGELKGRGAHFLYFHCVALSPDLSRDLKGLQNGESWCRGKKVSIVEGKMCNNSWDQGFSLTLALPPLRIVLHTRAYIFTVNTKPSLYRGPSISKCLELSREIGNVHIMRCSGCVV